MWINDCGVEGVAVWVNGSGVKDVAMWAKECGVKGMAVRANGWVSDLRSKGTTAEE